MSGAGLGSAGGALRAERVLGATTFVAIDFETANRDPRSVCAVGLVRVREDCLVHGVHRLVRPPAGPFLFSYIHGLTANDVRRAPSFAEVWADMVPLLAGAEFLAAHNALFDRRVLRASCGAAGLPPPRRPFQCSLAWSRAIWNPPRADLASMCRLLRIPLTHHDPLSDARACAEIMLRVRRTLRAAASRDGRAGRGPFTEAS